MEVIERVGQEVLPQIQEKAIKLFARTEDPLEGSFILSDGSFLKMGGEYCYYNKDHYSIAQIYEDLRPDVAEEK